MDRRPNQGNGTATFRMPSCKGINLTDADMDYYHKIHYEKSWAWWLNHIGTFVVFIIGVCGNMLCLLVLCRRRLRRNSYTQYLIALAIVDIGAIVSEVLAATDELYQHQRVDKRTLFQGTALSCKLYYYIRFIFYSMSSWVIVALALERLVAIRFPLWSKYICTVVNARRILFIVLLFSMISQSYHFIFKGLDCSPSSKYPQNRTCRCKTLPGRYGKLDIIFHNYIWRLILMTILPLTIIITVNILIMNKLFSDTSLIDHTNTSGNARRKMILLYKISKMLVIVSSVYLILHVPGSTLEIVKYMYVYVFKVCNMKRQYYITITHEIFDLLTNFNYGINFYLYIISGKHIRNELVRAFKHSRFRSSSSTDRNGKQRSSYFMSSYTHTSKNHQTQHSNPRRTTASSIQHLSSF